MIANPFSGTDATNTDRDLVADAQAGSRDALEQLIARHQSWIYNIVLRMVYHPHDAEDITQEILIKVVTKLSTFERRSAFRTWLYRIAVNHVLNMKRTRAEEWEMTFERYGRGLHSAPDEDFPDTSAIPVDAHLVLEEAKVGCTSGMLLCLTREQRIIYILGEIFGVTDVVGSELVEISRENFRQKLARARRDLHQFMHGQCGLVNEANPCRCAKKTQAFMKAGYVDPKNLVFVQSHVARVREVAPKALEGLEALDAAYAELHRGHPFPSGPDFVASLRRLMGGLTIMLLILSAAVMSGCAATADDDASAAIIALEKGALDKWSKGDPSGFYEIMANDETYFDPMAATRVAGLDALKKHMAPFAGTFSIDRVELVNPQVIRSGDLAVLNFNFVGHGAQASGGKKTTSRWNTTEVYSRSGGTWKIVHSHWSYTKPELKAAN